MARQGEHAQSTPLRSPVPSDIRVCGRPVPIGKPVHEISYVTPARWIAPRDAHFLTPFRSLPQVPPQVLPEVPERNGERQRLRGLGSDRG